MMRYADGIELRFIHGPDFITFHGERGTLKMRRNHFETDPPDLVPDRPAPSIGILSPSDLLTTRKPTPYSTGHDGPASDCRADVFHS